MRNLALAVLQATSKFELWDDETVNPDEAAEALEQVAAILSECSDEEKNILAEVAQESAEIFQKINQREAAEFCANFMANAGLE